MRVDHPLSESHLLTFCLCANASSMNAKYIPFRNAGLTSPPRNAIDPELAPTPASFFLGGGSTSSEGRGLLPLCDMAGVAVRLIGLLETGLERGAAAAI